MGGRCGGEVIHAVHYALLPFILQSTKLPHRDAVQVLNSDPMSGRGRRESRMPAHRKSKGRAESASRLTAGLGKYGLLFL